MGLYAHNENLYLTTRYQIWQLENRLVKNEQHQGGDRLYVPSQSHTTGDLNVHDVVVTDEQKILFINTDFSCIAYFVGRIQFRSRLETTVYHKTSG